MKILQIKYSIFLLLIKLISLVCVTGLVCSAQNNPNFQTLLNDARAKTASKEWVEAAKLWEEVVRINPVESRFWRQLANTQFSSQDYQKAIIAFEKNLELGGDAPANSAYNIATCYALLKEKEQALQWLERAFDDGFPNLERVRQDANFAILKDEVRFQKIVGSLDTSKMSREDGWRYDLSLLEQEVKRKGYNQIPRKFSYSEFVADLKKIRQAVPQLTDTQISLELTKLIVKLGDGHTAIFGARTRPEFKFSLPIKFYLFQEGLFIIAAEAKYKDLLGSQVINYAGQDVERVLQTLEPFVSRDNEMQLKETAPALLRFPDFVNEAGIKLDTKKVSLTIKDLNGKLQNVEVTVDDATPFFDRVLPNNWVSYSQNLNAPLPLYLKNLNSLYWFEYLAESKTVYFQYNNVINDNAEPLALFAERLFKFINQNVVEKLVIDMRWNSGGNAFLNQPLLLKILSNEKINQPRKLFIIIGRKTFSAAQISITLFERFTNAIFVGEPSGSSPNFIGEATPFVLPYSKLRVNISHLYWANSTPLDYRKWIAPTLYTPPTFEAYKNNRDSSMEAILKYNVSN